MQVDQRNRLISQGQDVYMITADKTLDIKGLVQPRPVIVIEMTMDRLDQGQVLAVITNDASTREAVPALCARRGYALLETTVQGNRLQFTIQKKS